MAVDSCTEVGRLVADIDRAAQAADAALSACTLGGVAGSAPMNEGSELCRQLTSLRNRVATALQADDDPRSLRSELATLLFFATTLAADAAAWRAGLDAAIREHERQAAAERRERERRAAEREALVRRRDALQSAIVQTASRMAQPDGGECRNTLPVFTLGTGLTVCSVSVSSPGSRFRSPKHWLVTLDGSHEAVVIRRI